MPAATNASSLAVINRWFQSQCNGDWEHQVGITLETVDNPGWRLCVDQDDTARETAVFDPLHEGGNDGPDWLHLSKQGTRLEGACGTARLDDMLGLVARWLTDGSRDA